MACWAFIWFGRYNLVGSVWFGKFGLVVLVQFGRFRLVWFGRFGSVWYVWFGFVNKADLKMPLVPLKVAKASLGLYFETIPVRVGLVQ